MIRRIARITSAVMLGSWASLTHAQTSPLPLQTGVVASAILTVSSDRLYAETLFGRRVAQEIEAQSAVLAAENRRMEAELVAEEQELTRQRDTLPAEEFRARAVDFDTRVQDIRRTQEAKARAVTERQETDQILFLQAARPVLVQIMQEAGAAVILERSSVLLSANATDITDLAIRRIDALLGDGLEPPDP